MGPVRRIRNDCALRRAVLFPTRLQSACSIAGVLFMKNQLLEDFGDSRSSPASAREAAPRRSGNAAAEGRRSQVWRGRQPEAAPRDEPPAEQETQPNWNEPFMAADFPAFASQQPDPAIQYPDEPAPWFDRWGRKALGWTAGLLLALGVAGGAFWMYHESQVESTLALVADQTPPAAPPVAAQPVALPAQPAPPAEPQVLALDENEAVEPADAAAAAPVIAAAVPEPPPKPKTKPRKRPPERTVLARSEPRPVRAAAAPPPEPPREDTLAETLRQCRAAGYHATLCVKRGCVATKFGLACRG
jgi:hypothetical protein